MTNEVLRSIARNVESNGDRVVLSFVDFEDAAHGIVHEMTWKQLWHRSIELGTRLAATCGVGGRAAIMCPQNLDYVVAFVACLASGVAAVPLYEPRPFMPMSRVVGAIIDARADAVVTTQAYAAEIAAICVELRISPAILTADIVTPHVTIDRHPAMVSGDSIAYLQYTSGSTSDPRGVEVTHDNIDAQVDQLVDAFEFDRETRFCSWLPFFHDMGLMAGIIAPLAVGGHAALCSPVAFLEDPARWVRMVDTYRSTLSCFPNTALDMCVRRVSEEVISQVDLSCLRTLIIGSEPIRAESLRGFIHRFGPCGIEADALRPSYGLAEATLFVSTTPMRSIPRITRFDRVHLNAGRVVPTDDVAAGREVVSCGRPVGQQIQITSATGEVLDENVIGEIRICGPNVAAGYFGRIDSATTFPVNPHTGEIQLRTGDIGVVRDGELHILDRIKDLIIIGGRNHYCYDIEATIEEACSSVRTGRSAAFTIGEGQERMVVVAEIRAAQRDTVTTAEYRRNIRRLVAAYHGIRIDDIVFIEPGELPRTTSGKVQRSSARLRYLQGEFTQHTKESVLLRDSDKISPLRARVISLRGDARCGALRDYLVARLSAMLDLGEGPIDTDEPLAAYGLTSVVAAELATEVGKALAIDLPVATMWTHPTVDLLADHLATTLEI